MTPSTAKSKGRETENIFIEYMRRWIPSLERRRLMGSADQGDVTGWPGVCVEVKSGAKIDMPKWLSELAAEKINSRADVAFVAVRLKGKPKPEDWCVVMPLPEFTDLLSESGWLPKLEG